MRVSNKLFVLLLVAMVLTALASVVLVLAGHEALVRDAASSIAALAAGAAAIGFIIFLVIVG